MPSDHREELRRIRTFPQLVKYLRDHLDWPVETDSFADRWRTNWSSAFTLRPREVIATSKDLAVRLADLASAIRRKVNAALAVETENGRLRKLMKAFRESLIHDLKEDEFAETKSSTPCATRTWKPSCATSTTVIRRKIRSSTSTSCS